MFFKKGNHMKFKPQVIKCSVLACAVASLLLVTACGNTPGQRALSGGAIGAGAGAVGAAILNTNPVTGAIVGGAVGAVTGAVTDKKDIDLGDIK
jgi:osmotically inducible lipoprotein OsmB